MGTASTASGRWCWGVAASWTRVLRVALHLGVDGGVDGPSARITAPQRIDLISVGISGLSNRCRGSESGQDSNCQQDCEFSHRIPLRNAQLQSLERPLSKLFNKLRLRVFERALYWVSQQGKQAGRRRRVAAPARTRSAYRCQPPSPTRSSARPARSRRRARDCAFPRRPCVRSFLCMGAERLGLSARPADGQFNPTGQLHAVTCADGALYGAVRC